MGFQAPIGTCSLSKGLVAGVVLLGNGLLVD